MNLRGLKAQSTHAALPRRFAAAPAKLDLNRAEKYPAYRQRRPADWARVSFAYGFMTPPALHRAGKMQTENGPGWEFFKAPQAGFQAGFTRQINSCARLTAHGIIFGGLCGIGRAPNQDTGAGI